MTLRIKPAAVNYGSLRDALAANAWTWCENCNSIMRERDMVGDLCSSCFYEFDKPKGGEKPREERKDQGDEVLLGSDQERDEKPTTPKGPIQLCLGGD